LDCWDDSIGYPVVYHGFRGGYTFTSKIPFQAIIACVKAFLVAHPDTLPIILSLENHCSPPFQDMMAVILKNTLEEHVFSPENFYHWPSPLDLLGKVILKGRISHADDDYDSISLHQTFSSTMTPGNAPDNPYPETAPRLSRMILLNGVHFSSLDASLDLPYTDMHSYSEDKFLKVLNKTPANVSRLKEFNTQHFTR
jgi:hypothetical protein